MTHLSVNIVEFHGGWGSPSLSSACAKDYCKGNPEFYIKKQNRNEKLPGMKGAQTQGAEPRYNYQTELSQSAKGKLVDMLTPFLIAPHLLQMENESEATKP